MHNIKFHKGKDGDNYVTIKAGNGEPIMHTEGVKNKHDLKYAIFNFFQAIRTGDYKVTGLDENGELNEENTDAERNSNGQ